MSAVLGTRAERIAAILAAADETRMAELVDDPNPAISTWRMLPNRDYGGVFEGRKLVGYAVGVHGKRKFMPLVVAKRLITQGKCKVGLLGNLWIQVNMDWKPKATKAVRS